MDRADVLRILAPIQRLASVADWNAPAAHQLAELISPRTAADLTVRELLDLMEQV